MPVSSDCCINSLPHQYLVHQLVLSRGQSLRDGRGSCQGRPLLEGCHPRNPRARPTIFPMSASVNSSTSPTASVVTCSHRFGVKCRPEKPASLSRAIDASSLTCGEFPRSMCQYSMPCPGLGSARPCQRSAIWLGSRVKHPPWEAPDQNAELNALICSLICAAIGSRRKRCCRNRRSISAVYATTVAMRSAGSSVRTGASSPCAAPRSPLMMCATPAPSRTCAHVAATHGSPLPMLIGHFRRPQSSVRVPALNPHRQDEKCLPWPGARPGRQPRVRRYLPVGRFPRTTQRVPRPAHVSQQCGSVSLLAGQQDAYRHRRAALEAAALPVPPSRRSAAASALSLPAHSAQPPD